MNFIFAILIILISASLIVNYIIYIRNRSKYLKAGKKWDEIVRELSRRK